jgi:hypothetical protein
MKTVVKQQSKKIIHYLIIYGMPIDNDIKIAIRSSFIYKMCCVGPRLITTAQFSLKLTTHLWALYKIQLREIILL